jgi:hypothetical protein
VRLSRQGLFAAAAGLVAAATSVYAWRVTGAQGHLVAAAGFVTLGLVWGRSVIASWVAVLLILGGSALRWFG